MLTTNYTIFYLLILFTSIQSFPSNHTDWKTIDNRFNQNLSEHIDGSVHHIKYASISYTQRIHQQQCFVQYDNQMLAENSVIKIRKKTFRVENCLLERVYHACGPNLILMLSIVCRVVERHKDASHLISFKRDISMDLFDRSKRVITESCCENFCGITELTRYCHD